MPGSPRLRPLGYAGQAGYPRLRPLGYAGQAGCLLRGANTGILLPEGFSRFAFRRPCPVECNAYSSGVSEKQKKTKNSALSATLR